MLKAETTHRLPVHSSSVSVSVLHQQAGSEQSCAVQNSSAMSRRASGSPASSESFTGCSAYCSKTEHKLPKCAMKSDRASDIRGIDTGTCLVSVACEDALDDERVPLQFQQLPIRRPDFVPASHPVARAADDSRFSTCSGKERMRLRISESSLWPLAVARDFRTMLTSTGRVCQLGRAALDLSCRKAPIGVATG